MRYYFDILDDGKLGSDDIGAEFSSLEAVKKEASRALGELARDALAGSDVRTFAIEVRNELGPVLRVSLRFEVEQCRR